MPWSRQLSLFEVALLVVVATVVAPTAAHAVVDLALNRACVSSRGGQAPSSNCALYVDGDDATGYQTLGGAGVTDDQYCVDLGVTPASVSQYRLLITGNSLPWTRYVLEGTSVVTLLTAADCREPTGTVGWTTVLVVSSPSADSGIVNLAAAQSYRMWRISAQGAMGACGTCINTFSLFGSADGVADTTPPTTTATAAPLANAAGWNSGDVTVTVAAVDNTGGSGVRDITYSLSGAQTAAARTVPASTASTTIAAEGTTTLTYFATDNAGNGEAARTLLIRLDRTAPEAFHRFDPLTQDLAVFGRDALAGPASAGAIAPLSVVVVLDDDDEPDEDDGNRERRTYRIEDRAGNSLVLVELVKREGHELKATVESLRYNDGALITPARNKTKLEWALKAGALKEPEQKLEVGRGRDKQEVEAKFEAKKNRTTIKVDKSEPERKLERPGLALLRLATDRGMLHIEFD